MSSPASTRTSDAIRAELLAIVDPKAVDERLVVELAANGAALALQLASSADRLARLLPDVLAEPKKAHAVARVLHDLVALETVLARRVEGALRTAATLRIQRRVHERGKSGF